MFKIIGWIIKLTFFSTMILILGNWVQWRGKTVSDQIKTQLSHAEKSQFAGSLKHWTTGVTEDARKGAKKRKERSEEFSIERIPSSERQKLRTLIEELNTTSSKAERKASR